MPSYKHKRGSIENLPVEGAAGELFITTDTAQLYGGQGTGKPLLQLSTMRYAVGEKSFVTATGLNITITKLSNTCSFTIPKNVILLSASIYFSAEDIAKNTTCRITLPNSSDSDFYLPQFQVLADVVNARMYKTGVVGNFNTAINVLELTALKANQAIWVNIIF